VATLEGKEEKKKPNKKKENATTTAEQSTAKAVLYPNRKGGRNVSFNPSGNAYRDNKKKQKGSLENQEREKKRGTVLPPFMGKSKQNWMGYGRVWRRGVGTWKGLEGGELGLVQEKKEI